MKKNLIMILWSAMIAVSGASLSGCETPEPTTPKAEAMTPALRALKIVPVLDGEKNPLATAAFDAVQSELVRAGYSVTRDEEASAVVARLDVSTREEPSVFTVVVNGQRKVTYKVTVRLVVEGKDGTSIFLAEQAHESSEEDGPSSTARTLIGRLRSSGKLGAYAAQRQKDTEARDLREQQKKEDEEEEKAAEKRRMEAAAKKKETDTWESSNVSGCTEPITPSSCDGTKAYLTAYPTGRFAAQARQALEVGTVKIGVMQMEADWQAIDLAACRTPKTPNDCDAVKAHLTKFAATSTHRDGARAVLAKVEKRLEQLEKAAQAKEAAEEARAKAEEKKAAMESCRDQCKDACIDWRTGGVRGPCLQRCMARDCR